MERTHTIPSASDYIRLFKVDKPFNDTNFNDQISAPFKDDILTSTVALTTTFEKCTFNENVKIISDKNKYCVLTFVDCVFEKDVIAKDAVMDGKVRFRNCTFEGNVNFRNTTFNALLDLWRSTFEKETIFYKTDFMDIVVLSAVTFQKNVLFTYALIDKLLILRGTKALEGFDLSLAIIPGTLSVFDFKLKYFDSYNCHKQTQINLSNDNSKEYLKYFEEVYEDAVSVGSEIPINNKRETYRILKKYHESQSNIVESIPFAVLEKRTLFHESALNLWYRTNKKNKFTAFSNLWVLSWNAISNWFSSSYILGGVFTVLIAALFFNLSLLYTAKAEFAFDLHSSSSGIKDFLNFFNPVHKFDYLGEDNLSSKIKGSCFYVYDFVGRLFVGYGIYQTVQAFRKFR